MYAYYTNYYNKLYMLEENVIMASGRENKESKESEHDIDDLLRTRPEETPAAEDTSPGPDKMVKEFIESCTSQPYRYYEVKGDSVIMTDDEKFGEKAVARMAELKISDPQIAINTPMGSLFFQKIAVPPTLPPHHLKQQEDRPLRNSVNQRITHAIKLQQRKKFFPLKVKA